MLECVVFCEARADAETAQLLADRVALEDIDWLDGIIDHVRHWRGERHPEGESDWYFIKWSHLKTWDGRKVHGHYGGPNRGEYVQARKALIWTVLTHPNATAVILMRDDDGAMRRSDYEAARTHTSRLAVIIGIAEPEREAWCIAAFDAIDETEKRRLTAEMTRLGKNPCHIAHTLNPKRECHPRSTKKVLDALTEDNDHIALRGLRSLPLEDLIARGREVGLAAYLEDLRTRFVPLLSASRPA